MFKWLFGSKDGGAAESSPQLISIARRIDAPIDQAFAAFVDRIGEWWPRDLTWAKDNLAAFTIQPRMNGRCIEKSKDGSEAVWGTVLTISRPSHIVIAWQIRPDREAEPEPAAASRVDVRFAAEGDGATRVVLVHRDFFRHGDGWEKYKTEMAAKTGWPRLMDLYAAAAPRPT